MALNSRGSIHPETGRISGMECTPMSDGTTTFVKRADPAPVFEQFQTALYPRNLKDHKEHMQLQAALADNYSLVANNDVINSKEKDLLFKNVAKFDTTLTFDKVVMKDINKMTGTVSDEFKDTLGLPRPRKIAPVKEAKKRMEKNEKSIKEQVTEQLAREHMKYAYYNPLKNPTLKDKAAGKFNPIVDEKFKKGVKLESLFNPSETKKLDTEI